MKKQILLATLALSGIVSMTACKKDNDDPVQPTTTMNNAADFVAKYGAPKQTFSFNATELPKTFTLAGGTKITLQANSLTLNGVPVTGSLTLEAYEILKRSTAIFTGTNTNHISGSPLISDGFIFVDVKANNISVDRVVSGSYTIEMPTVRDGEYTNLWVGNTNVNGMNQLGWAPPMNGGADSVKAVDSLFGFSMRELGWTNCDVFYANNNPKTTITVTVPNNPGAFATFLGGTGETFVLFCAQGENVVAQLYTPAGTNMVKSYDNAMPIGVTGRLLAFAIKEGKFYMVKEDVTITANMAKTLTLVETTEDALQAEIAALDSY
jgi:hypothetical protein